MNLSIEGTYKYRVRTKILWFWVVEPWKTINISYSQNIGPASSIRTIKLAPIPGVPIEFQARIESNSVRLDIDVIGQAIWAQAVALPLGVSKRFQGEPIKGCILDVRAMVTEP